MPQRILNNLHWLFWLLIGIDALIVFFSPLLAAQNDSFWYFMNVHYVQTGEYIHEAWYPSFKEPSQMYPFFGYSFFIYLCVMLSKFFFVSWPALLKILQFCMFIYTAVLLRKSILLLSHNKTLSALGGILYLLYFPFFNFTFLLMSETYALFLLFLVFYFFLLIFKSPAKKNMSLFSFFSGAALLVKPSFLPFLALMFFFILLQCFREKKFKNTALLLFILALPLAQICYSKIHHHNYAIRTGSGWNLWNRTVQFEHYIPEKSPMLDSVKTIYSRLNKPVPYDYWWEITKDLSAIGYKERDIQNICLQVALDAIKEHKTAYFLGTFKYTFLIYSLGMDETQIFSDSDQYLQYFKAYPSDKQHQVLLDDLAAQNPGNDFFRKLDQILVELYRPVKFLFSNAIVFILFSLFGLYHLFHLLKSRFRSHLIEFSIFFGGFSIIFTSVLAEIPQSRYLFPAMIFFILLLCVDLFHAVKKLSGSKSDSSA